jgi:transglutaminase-like putative cysteine protease
VRARPRGPVTGPGRKGGHFPATLALTAVTLVTAAGMGRLFQGLTYLVPVLLAGAVAHALSFTLRRWRVPVLLSALASAAEVLLVPTWAIFPSRTLWGIPVGKTWGAVTNALAQSRLDFQTMHAPAPATPGFLFLAMVGIGTAAVLSDAAALRLGTAIEGLLPSFGILIFTAGLGVSSGQAAATGGWVAAALTFLLTVEVERRWGSLAHFTTGTGARWMLATAGAALSIVAIIGALVVGPSLPGASARALVNWHSQGGTGRRVTLSPLVDIRAELLEPSRVEVFTVATSAPSGSYWRLTALDSFNGLEWSADDYYHQVGSTLPGAGGPEAARTVTQTFTIKSLDSAWLPAAYRPVAVSGVPGATFDPRSASLIAPSATTRGLHYTVVSRVPTFTPAELATARIDTGDPALARYLALPGSLPQAIVALARQVVRGQATPYGKALALQEFFRRNFRYSLNVPASSSNDALMQFLFHTKEGYCQQFAGAYAVMARAVGLPARVAVGFTQGQRSANGVYHVLALDAHAWPEVDLGQFGWVPFEPTPGRGAAAAATYTHVQPAQANPTTAPAATAITTATTAPTTLANTKGRGPSKIAPQLVGRGRFRVGGTSPAPGGGSRSPSSAAADAGWAVLSMAGLGALALSSVPVLLLVRRRRRWARACGEGERVLLAFAEASESLARLGRVRHPAETFGQYARRVGPWLSPDAGRAIISLAEAAERAAFARDGSWAGASGDKAAAALCKINRAVRNQVPASRRLAWWFDPRPLLGGERARQQAGHVPLSLVARLASQDFELRVSPLDPELVKEAEQAGGSTTPLVGKLARR